MEAALSGLSDGAVTAETLHRLVVGPLGAYIEHECRLPGPRQREGVGQARPVTVVAAEALLTKAGVAAFQLGQGIALDEPTLRDLRSAWLEFIGSVEAQRGAAANAILDRAQAQRIAASKLRRANGKELTPERLVDWLAARGKDQLTEPLKLQAAADFNCSVKTVSNRQKEARELGLLPRRGASEQQ